MYALDSRLFFQSQSRSPRVEDSPDDLEGLYTRSLPPLEARLPDNPFEATISQSATYGGTISGSFRVDDLDWFRQFSTSDGLVEYYPGSNDLLPGLAERWELSPDQKELTVYLRQGVKWSDGAPFTADDIAFWYNAIERNPNIPDVTPLVYGGDEVGMAKIDDYTVKYFFSHPLGELSSVNYPWNRQFFAPSHYYKKFHPDFSPYAGYAQLRHRLFLSPDSNYLDVDRPVVQAWVVTRFSPSEGVVAGRNPYYWKVDQDYNQLPYIDRIEMAVSSTGDSAKEDSELDAQLRSFQDAVMVVPFGASAVVDDLHSLARDAETALQSRLHYSTAYTDIPFGVLQGHMSFLVDTSHLLLELGGDFGRLPETTQLLLLNLQRDYAYWARQAEQGGAGPARPLFRTEDRDPILVEQSQPVLSVCVHATDAASSSRNVTEEQREVCRDEHLRNGLQVYRTSPLSLARWGILHGRSGTLAGLEHVEGGMEGVLLREGSNSG